MSSPSSISFCACRPVSVSRSRTSASLAGAAPIGMTKPTVTRTHSRMRRVAAVHGGPPGKRRGRRGNRTTPACGRASRNAGLGAAVSCGSARRMPRTAWAIRCSFSTSAKRTNPSPPGPNPTPGADGDVRLPRQLDGELERAELAVRLRDRRPDEHRPERPLDVPADALEPVAEDVAAAAVDLAGLGRIVARLVQRDDRGDLDRLEGAVVEIGLEPRERRERRRIAEREADAPAGHRERLRQRVGLDRDVGGAGNLEDRGRQVAVERDVGVGEVVHDERLVARARARRAAP